MMAVGNIQLPILKITAYGGDRLRIRHYPKAVGHSLPVGELRLRLALGKLIDPCQGYVLRVHI